MGFTDEEAREIAGKAQTLFERHGTDNETTGQTHVDPDGVLKQWDKLFENCSLGDRLTDLDWDEDTVRQICHRNKLPATEPLPGWISTANELLQFVENASLPDQAQFGDAAFGRFHTLLVRFAHGRVEDRIDSSVLGDDALAPSLRWLYRRLSERFVRVLYVELKSFVATHDEELARADPREYPDRPTEFYEQFLSVLVEDGGLRDVFEAYPVFTRFLSVQLDNWVDATAELVSRVEKDSEQIRQQFSTTVKAGSVTEVEPLADDTHAGGRTATKVTFRDGTSVVYSPRSVEPAVRFYEGLRTLDERTDIPTQYTPKLLSMDSYGWREFITRRECSTEAEVERYYRRAGVLLLWSSVTNTTDLQNENVLSHGEYPVLLDLETFMEPYVDPSDRPFPFSGMERIEDTSIFTSLAPWGVEDPGKVDTDLKKHAMAGFGSTTDPVVVFENLTPQVVAPNSDVMSVEMTQPELEGNTNVPQLDGVDQPPHDYVSEIQEGFNAAYNELREFIQENSSLEELFETEQVGDETNRPVVRPTKHYVDVIQSALAREPLIDGAYLTVAVEELATPFFDGWVPDDTGRDVYDYEREAILRLEPPRFESSLDSREIRYDGQETGMLARESGLERTRETIERMGRSDLKRERRLVAQLFEAAPGEASTGSVESPELHESLEASAVDHLETIESSTIEMTTPASRPFYERTSIRPNVGESGLTLKFAGESIATGLLGPGLLAGALYRLTEEEVYAESARDLVAPIQDLFDRTEGSLDVGGFHGTGALVYGFSLLAGLVGDDQYRELVSNALTRFSPSDLRETDHRDLRGGTSGLCVACLGADQRVADSRLTDIAEQSGRRLLDQLSRNDTTHGFDQGDAGAAYALARLGAETGDERFSTVAQRVFDELSSPVDKDKFINKGQQSSRISHGQIGNVYAKLATSSSTDLTFHTSREVNLANEYCSTEAEYDQLTSGNAGRAELAVTMTELGLCDSSGVPDHLVERLKRSVDDVVTVGSAAPVQNVSFLHGLSGVGYTALRAIDPSLPSVYMFE
ncbi:type 2 lanthipeptide synthetase LanM family protein [Halobaculum sp. MBLA0143]|uniref:type 2 lanthipeptide synthetase LanM family protein n=1 Tax=Halobaculum sp. MBLA0143 TaxID=3079933 RepID=UPI003525085A